MVQRLHMLAIITARRIYSYVLHFNLWAHFEHSTTLQNTQAPMQRTLMLILKDSMSRMRHYIKKIEQPPEPRRAA